MLKDEETDSEKITNFSSPWRQWGTEASLKPILVPKGQVPSWKLCCFAFWLLSVLLQAFHFYGRNDLPDTDSALTTSLPPGQRLASITQKNLWNSVLLHIQASACLTLFSVQNCSIFTEQNSSSILKMKRQLVPGKQTRSWVPTLAQSKVTVFLVGCFQGLSPW